MGKSTLLKLLIGFCAVVGLAIASIFLITTFFFGSSETNLAEISSNANQALNSKVVNVANNRHNPIWNNKVAKDDGLQTQANALLKIFDNMPPVPIYLKDEPILPTGTNTERGLAYTICEDSNKPTIFVKKVFYQKNNQKQITNVLKHELVHAWFCRQGVQVGHDEQFRRKFESIGGFGN
jgi:SprT-like family